MVMNGEWQEMKAKKAQETDLERELFWIEEVVSYTGSTLRCASTFLTHGPGQGSP